MKAFTLIEIFVCIAIVVICLILAAFNAHESQKLSPFLFPAEARAEAQQDLVKEMAEQNRLMRELLQQKSK